MGQFLLFHMWEPYRQSLIKDHLFYAEQAKKRLLSQFNDIGGEADKAAESWLDENKTRFDPGFHDPGYFDERAWYKEIEFYQLLCDMRDHIRLSVVAGMYHEWDKQLRKWLTQEIRYWHRGKTVLDKIWAADFGKLADLMGSLGWRIRDQAYFLKLDACRLVVNVYKHGNGNSFDELKEKYPEYLRDPLSNDSWALSGRRYLDYTHLVVNENQIQGFSDAIVAFWRDVPKDIFYREDLEVPGWFARAISVDQQAARDQHEGLNP